MRAVVFHKFGPFDSGAVENMPDPVPAAGELLVEIRVAPVNYVDTVVIAGKYQFKPPLPFIPGKGPVGVVVGISTGVQGWSIGDCVLAMVEVGGYAEKVCAAASQCYRLPRTMSFEHASTISLAYDTAWFGLRERGRLADGSARAQAAWLLRAEVAGRQCRGRSSPETTISIQPGTDFATIVGSATTGPVAGSGITATGTSAVGSASSRPPASGRTTSENSKSTSGPLLPSTTSRACLPLAASSTV